MLWIAWAKGRDLGYWEKQDAVINYRFSEEWDWAPLLGELTSLGVWTAQFTTSGGFDPRGGMPTTINMPAFIRWAKSPLALTVVFVGLSTNGAGLKEAFTRITER